MKCKKRCRKLRERVFRHHLHKREKNTILDLYDLLLTYLIGDNLLSITQF